MQYLSVLWFAVGPGKRSDGDAPSPKVQKKLSRDKEGLVVKSGDTFTVGDATYKKSVLVDILAKVYKVDRKEAEAKCFGFGMDPRPIVAQRMLSCYCGAEPEAQCHQFPRGYTFAVKDKYEDFR